MGIALRSLGVFTSFVQSAAPRQSGYTSALRHLGAFGLFFLAILDSSPMPTFGGLDILTAILAARHREPWYLYAGVATAGSVIGAYLTFRMARRLVGTGIVAAAYIPQIRHLIKEHCSAGISVRAYILWFLGALFFVAYAVMIRDAVFIIAQVLNLAAICAIVIYARRYKNGLCPLHRHLLLDSRAAPNAKASN